MWTFMSLHVDLAATGHFIDANTSLNSISLGMVTSPQAHTAENLVCVQTSLVQAGSSNETRFVTDGALGVSACGRELEHHHLTCIAPTFHVDCKGGSWFVPTTVLQLPSRYQRLVTPLATQLTTLVHDRSASQWCKTQLLWQRGLCASARAQDGSNESYSRTMGAENRGWSL